MKASLCGNCVIDPLPNPFPLSICFVSLHTSLCAVSQNYNLGEWQLMWAVFGCWQLLAFACLGFDV